MSSAAWNWLLAIAGTLASIGGLVFSGMAWLQAAKAKEAAKEAVKAVQKREVAQEVLRLAGDAKEFLSAVQQSRTENAVSAANSLSHALSIIRARGIANPSDANKLKECVAQITFVAIRINVDGIPADPTRWEEIPTHCHDIHKTVCDLAGRMERASEGASS